MIFKKTMEFTTDFITKGDNIFGYTYDSCTSFGDDNNWYGLR